MSTWFSMLKGVIISNALLPMKTFWKMVVSFKDLSNYTILTLTDFKEVGLLVRVKI